MREFLRWCDELGIKVVTIYLLSSDNLTGRSAEELAQLFEIIADLADDLSRAADWRIQHVGTTDGLPDRLVGVLRGAEARTARNPGLHVNLAVGYGGRREIADAMRSIVRSHGKGGGSIDDLAEILTPELIGDHLYTQGQPDPDLIIRTSGEQRLSDFMLWQSAHSEFYFVEALGPDLREVDFLRALRDYAGRERRWGR
jgi:short-chain Z-isoprenyl diphosphate synthase